MAVDQVIEGQKADKFILSQDPNQAMLEMMQALDALRTVYDEENDALVNANTRRFMDLQERKIQAAQRYHDTAAQVIEHRDELKSADPVLRQRLQDMHGDFAILTEQNLGHIERMNKSVKRLSERVVKGARDAALRDSASYSRRGTLYGNNRPVSTGLNESA